MEQSRSNPFWTFCREIFENLPVVFVLYTAFRLLGSSLTWFAPPKYEWVWTIIFPLFWVYAFLWVRLYLNKDIKNRNSIMYLFIAGTIAAFAGVLMQGHSTPPTLDAIILDHEYVTFFWVTLLMLHCLVTRGVSGFAMFFMIGLLYGALLESSGIQMGFFFEPDYHWYAPDALRPIFRAPVATILGWTTVFYPTWFITSRIFEKLGITNRVIAAFNASLVGLFIDLQVDPVASEIGLWNWNESLEPGFLGVPTLNFVSWFWAVPPFAYMVFLVNSKEEWSVKKRLLVLLISVPFCQMAAGILSFSTMFFLEGATSPALRILFEGIKMQLSTLPF